MRETHKRANKSDDRIRAEALLFPLAAFLSAGGWSKDDAERSFSRAFDLSLDTQGSRQIKHIGDPAPYADMVALWLRDRRFLDSGGRAKALPLQGKVSFATLVREVGSKIDPQVALSVLTQFRNIRRMAKGKYKLVSPFFRAYSAKSLAFEPMANFLSDASDTLGRILKRKEGSRSLDLFWRTAETSNLSDAGAKQFFAFSKERTLAFVNEIDEWLEAHRSDNTDEAKRPIRRRVGLGVFSIFSAPDATRRKQSAPRRHY
jgi:Family of unknown function (DUF6502)